MPAKNRNKKPIVKQPKLSSKSSKTRKKPEYKSFRLQKRLKHPGPKLPNWWILLKKVFALLAVNKKPIFVFFILYAVLNILLVRGIAPTIDISGIQESYEELGIETSGWAAGLTAFGSLLQFGASNVNPTAQLYQLILIVVAALAFIWLFRQQQAGNQVTMKMAFYRGMYPIIPFVLIICVIGLQLIPATIGNFLFSTVVANGLVVGFLEQLLWLMLFIFTLILSFYWVSTSLIALFIVTLPEMTPMQSLREAKQLVSLRRISVMLKILALIVIIFLAIAIIILPLIFLNALIAEWVFFAITILLIPFTTAYLFSLYRELF